MKNLLCIVALFAVWGRSIQAKRSTPLSSLFLRHDFDTFKTDTFAALADLPKSIPEMYTLPMASQINHPMITKKNKITESNSSVHSIKHPVIIPTNPSTQIKRKPNLPTTNIKPIPIIHPVSLLGKTHPVLPLVEDDVTPRHECYRACKTGEKPKTCYYKFTLEWYQTMSRACFACPFNIRDCYYTDCVPGSGVIRPITVINRMMPGPKIEVCQNDTVIVDLENNLLSSTTTLHWHGMHQKSTPYMDGVPFVTQCPILPENTFRYKFKASEAGTHFYHSHIGLQRADGAFGALIVRRPKEMEPNRKLYTHDLSEHTMIVVDWTNKPAMGFFTEHYHGSGELAPASLLINGVGKFLITDTKKNRTAYTRSARFEVEKGGKYRFRLINNEFLVCPVELTVEGHNITVIASDGVDVKPITAAALVTYAGERFDFVINADKPVDNYWIKLRGLLPLCDIPQGAKQVAVLHYKGAKNAEPVNKPIYSRPAGVTVNPENSGEHSKKDSITVSQMRSYEGYDDRLKRDPDHKFFIGFDLYNKNHSTYHRRHYTLDQVQKNYRMSSPQLNHISMQLPKSPLLVTRLNSTQFCNEDTTNNSCITGFCQCPHVVSVKLNSIVELILVDEGKTLTANHPFHLHGHSFRVLNQVKLGNETTVEAVKKLDKDKNIKRNFDNPPIKDTVAVPDGGFSVIRFKASNPGYWLFHCHIEFHADMGMAMVFKVGEHEDMVAVPKGFPSCGDYGIPKNV